MLDKSRKKRLSNNSNNLNKPDKPIENHNNAAWADIRRTKPVSEVPVPSEFDVENAKEYVDENQK